MSNGPQFPSVELVIFGAAGDLTWRKLIPALYNLFIDHLLPQKFAIFGVDAKKVGVETLQKRLLEGVNQFSRRGKARPEVWKAFAEYITSTIAGDFKDTSTFEELARQLKIRSVTIKVRHRDETQARPAKTYS